ncbi:MAG: secretion protein, partial [Burkholderiaceae bacterium]|nr:secretion protein [Burkholderiaceae bacterium]
MSDLFRLEALEHRRNTWLGRIQLVRPVSFSVLTGLVALTALATGWFLFHGEYTRKAHVVGVL